MEDFKFTPLQGRYLAFISDYTKINRQPPAELDMQRYFEVTPPLGASDGLEAGTPGADPQDAPHKPVD